MSLRVLSRKQSFRPVDVALFTISGIVVLDQLASAASIGPSAIGWWVLTIILFAIPYAAITCELGTTWPAQGGVYVWIAKAFGRRWGARAIWLFWSQLTIWVGSVAILAASMMAELFLRDAGLAVKVAIAIGFILAVCALAVLKSDQAKWLPNMGALLKAALMIAIGAGGLSLLASGHAQTAFTPSGMLPSYEGALKFLPIIVFNLTGFELISAVGEEIENPQRNLPKAIFLSVFLIGGLYIFATFGILAAISPENISLDTGILDAARVAFGTSPAGELAIFAVGVGVVITLLTNMVTWSISVNRTMQAAAADREMPFWLSANHPRWGTPVAATLAMGATSIAITMIYSLMATDAEDLFWSLLTFSSVIFLLPYLLMFAGFVRLRLIAPDTVRPFRVPGGTVTAFAVAGLCTVFVSQAIVLFIYPIGETVDPATVLILLTGVGLVCLLGEILVRRSSSLSTVSKQATL